MLRAATSDDAAAIARIYEPFVTRSAVSFETEAPDAAEMKERFQAGAGQYPWLVAFGEEEICGYAYAARFRPRPAYLYAVETSVYVAEAFQGLGIGRRLYRSLIETLEAQGFAQAIAAITLPNEASVTLHERLGFQAAGVYCQVGYKHSAWHNVGLWQRALASPHDPPAQPLSLAQLEESQRG